jgi:hypothetical protein
MKRKAPLLENFERSKLEKAIIDFIIKTTKNTGLKKQLQNCIILSSNYTGVGYYVDFKIPEGISPIIDSGPIDGPLIKSEELEHGAGTNIFVTNGYISTLEIFSYGESFPRDIKDFTLTKV